METKFQSSFIPRGPVAGNAPPASIPIARARKRDFLSFIAGIFFALSVVMAIGVFSYKYFLNFRINQMGRELEEARATLEPETVEQIIRLDDRLRSTEELLSNHRIITPLFDLLQSSTPKTVRYTSFTFNSTSKGLEVKLVGEARGYAALATASEVLNQSPFFENPVYSDLQLDSRGNVTFSLTTTLAQDLVSYKNFIEMVDFGNPGTTTTSSGTSTPN